MNRERFQGYLTKEVALRLLASLALALILWALVTLRQDPETTRAFPDVPVQAVSLPESLMVVNEIEPVQVEVTGPKSDVDPIQTSSLVANVDFSGVTEPGTYTLPVKVNTPDGIWRSSVIPSSTSVVIEESITKQFDLTPVVTDTDENSLRTVTVSPEVTQVSVTGPSSRVEAITEVVLPVEVSGGTQTIEDVYVPEAHDQDGNLVDGVTIDPAAVNATVRVSARGKSVAVLANITGSPAAGYEVADRTVNPQFVIVDGDEDALDSLVALSTEPVDVTGADASFTRTVEITDIPEGLRVLQPASGQVEVLVQITQRGVRQSLPSQQVTVVGVAPGLTASVSPDEVTINVVASDEALASLDATSLHVVVDATGLSEGTYMVEPSVIIPPRVQWVSITPPEVQLTLSRADPSVETTEASPSAVPDSP